MTSHRDAKLEDLETAYRRAALRLMGREREEIALALRRAALNGGDPAVRAALRAIQRALTQPDGVYHLRWLEAYTELNTRTVQVAQAEMLVPGSTSVASGSGSFQFDVLRPAAARALPPSAIADAINANASRIGFDFSLVNPKLGQAVRERADKLATYIGQTTSERVNAAVEGQLSSGGGAQDIAAAIRKDAYDPAISRARAIRIARTEAVGSLNQGEFIRARETGIFTTKGWLHSGNRRDPRLNHIAMDGEKVDMAARFSNGLLHPGDQSAGLPGEVVNCFLPGTLVRGDFVGGVRTEYRGSVRIIQTQAGSALSVTPNHPVLTDQGFRPAIELTVGDYLVRDESIVEAVTPRSHIDEEDVPLKIEEVFAALSVLRTPLRAHLRADDLHGDAAFGVGDVDVVFANRELLLDSDAARAEFVRNFLLMIEDAGLAGLVCNSTLAQARVPVELAFSRSPRGGELSPLDEDAIMFDSAPFSYTRLACVAQIDTVLTESQSQRASRESSLVGDGFKGLALLVAADEGIEVADIPRRTSQADAARHELAFQRDDIHVRSGGQASQGFPALVTLDQIVEIRDSFHVGYVYDLMSRTGILSANNLICCNCGCSVEYFTSSVEAA